MTKVFRLERLSPPQDKFWVRLLVFILSIPFFYVIIFLLPNLHYLAFTGCCVIATLICVRELWLLFVDHRPRHWWSAGAIGALFPIGAYFENWGIFEPIDHSFTVSSVILLALIMGVFGVDRRKSLTAFTLEHTSSTLFLCCYPGLLISYIVRLVDVGQTDWVLLTFFVAVYGSDIAGYIAGKIARGRTTIGLPPSPSKTLIGYIASITMATLTLIIARELHKNGLLLSPIMALGLGIAIGIASSVGDLLESAIKRAANVKDSGNLIPGRGGLLDSIDSLLISAPIFYLWTRELNWAII